ncbi:uncharacterized protein LOC120629400 isoform X2 [Pararge aegeria]|uniref:uncharacterized protein LOC120629400 isoform X2 n=1 Tax=Pararge aegeria TaxID=116150 RepID=UPI0019CF84D1|nr:uncharacterized protein LOC120629400 isoform X2 [Pararge aegeria]
MINILSYIGMNLQSEVCLWTLLGLLRTIFDATLFKVNANLKQVWQMKMPPEMSLPVQRALRTMISGVMLAQCFTVYVYLASYIVLLYPVFLEERPTLVLPWLLLAAIRNLLCELTSLALGLGTCVLLGPARPPCIRFVIIKLASIMPAFYMWMLNFGYAEQVLLTDKIMTPVLSCIKESKQSLPIVSQVTSNADITSALDTLCPMSVTSNRTMSDIGTYEDWFGSEVVVPRDTDRILEQFVLMLMRIGAYLKKENVESIRHLNSHSQAVLLRHKQVECTAMPSEETDTPPLVGNTKGGTASYLRDYPQIFGKKTDILSTLNTSELAEVKSSSSSQSAKSTKGVSTETVEVKFKNLTIQESRDMFTYLQDKNNVDDVSEQIDNEQFLNNLKVDSGDKDEVGNNKTINEIRDSTEPNQSENKNKFKTSERILNLNKYKRKESK